LKKLVVTAAAVAAIAGGSMAAADVGLPARNALLGGGAIGKTFARGAHGHPDVAYTSIRVDKKTGKTLHLYGEWPTACKGRSFVTGVFDTVTSLGADGSFTATGTYPKNAFTPKGIRFQLSGRFTSPTSATGTGKLSFTFASDGKTRTCGSTTRFEVRTTPSVAGEPSPKPGAAYFGNTDDTFAVSLRVSRDGASVAQVAEEGWLECTVPTLKKGVYVRNTSPAAAIAKDGSFHGVETFDDPVSFGPGLVGKVHSEVAGAFGDGTVGGTWTVTSDVLDSKTHAKKGTCSGKVGWAASL